MADKKHIDEISGVETTGHEWDGIRELNNPMPRWWVYTFYATIVWAIGYTVMYPAWPLLTDNTKGLLGYSSRAEVAEELTAAKSAQSVYLEKIAALPLDQIVADKDLLRHQYKRQQRKQGMPLQLDDQTLHQHAHPLLAAWGKQGRDYIRLLDQFDQTQQFRQLFRGERIDLFSDYDCSHLLGQLQQDILELRDLPHSRQHWPQLHRTQAQSLCFARCHSIVRELEVLHDDLLAQLSLDPTLQFSDIMVMVPDINEYAAAIHAVFGRYRRDDDRCIPFTIADQAAKNSRKADMVLRPPRWKRTHRLLQAMRLRGLCAAPWPQRLCPWGLGPGAAATTASPAAARWRGRPGPCWPTPIHPQAAWCPGGCAWSAH